MAEIPNVCLSLQNRPENVLVVRQALTGVAESVGLNAIETNDINTAVTEACNNVVMHAYDGGEGPLEVDVYALSDAIAVLVRDHGTGMDVPDGEREDDDTLPSGLGLPVIQALARDVAISDRAGGGTEIRMEFDAPRAVELALTDGAGGRDPAGGRALDPTSTVELKLAPDRVARAVLPRVLSALAARAHFSTDRISDVQIVADVLAAKSQRSLSGSHLDVGVTIEPRNLELRLGPLHAGEGQNLLSAAADGLAPVIERLTDEHHPVASADVGGETLELKLVERGG